MSAVTTSTETTDAPKRELVTRDSAVTLDGPDRTTWTKDLVKELDPPQLYALEQAGEIARDVLDARIRRWVKRDKWTLTQIGEEIGVTPQAVSKRLKRLELTTASKRGRPRKVDANINRVEILHASEAARLYAQDVLITTTPKSGRCKAHELTAGMDLRAVEPWQLLLDRDYTLTHGADAAAEEEVNPDEITAPESVASEHTTVLHVAPEPKTLADLVREWVGLEGRIVDELDRLEEAGEARRCRTSRRR